MNNQIKTLVLLVTMSALLLWMGQLLGGSSGLMIALMISLVMNWGAYWFSDQIVLRLHGAKPLHDDDPSGVPAMVAELSQRAGIPMPKVYWIPERLPNAFATGRDPEHAAVAVTDGILKVLSPRELRGVLAHELGHIKNRDTLISTLVASLASAVMYFAHMMQWVSFSGGHSREENQRSGSHPLVMLATVIIAPIAATLIQMTISRTREFLADESGAGVSEDPEALASALQKISHPDLLKQLQRGDSSTVTNPAFSHLYIVNSLSAEDMFGWFSTHPPVRERVKRLLNFKKS